MSFRARPIKLFFYFNLLPLLYGQIETDSEIVRKIRLDNFKKNHLGKTIRFTADNSKQVQGVLIDVTNKDFVLSINQNNAFFDHESINNVIIPPVIGDLYITFGVATLGGLAGYAATIMAHPNPTNRNLGAVSTLSSILGFVVGKKTFYKPQEINLSGKLRD